jgi:hypothetical protein
MSAWARKMDMTGFEKGRLAFSMRMVVAVYLAAKLAALRRNRVNGFAVVRCDRA